jgi:cytoskeletal protein CcmA (bactofilin family)
MKPDVWEALELIEGQHWISSQFRGRGDLVFSGQLRFSGQWVGTITSNATPSALFVQEGAVVSGRLKVQDLIVAGTLLDVNVEAESFVALPGSRISGRIRAKKVSISEGAIIEGDLSSRSSDNLESTIQG